MDVVVMFRFPGFNPPADMSGNDLEAQCIARLKKALADDDWGPIQVKVEKISVEKKGE